MEGPPYTVVAILAILAVLGAPVAAAEPCEEEQGSVLVPWGPLVFSPPPVVDETMEDAKLIYYLRDVVPNKPFALYPVGEATEWCLLTSSCAPERIFVPDFNVAWYKANGSPNGGHKASGPDSGIVPLGSAYGVVYMRYGPDGMGDNDVSAKFQYDQYC